MVEHRQKKRMLEDRGALPREDGDTLREFQAMDEENLLVSWLREDVEGKEQGMERMNKDAKDEESKKGKGLRLMVIVCQAMFLRSSVPFVRWRVLGMIFLCVCVPASSLVVLVVTVPSSDLNVDCEVFLSELDCEFVEPRTFFYLSRKLEANVSLECETEMSFEGPPVKAETEAETGPHHRARCS